MHTQLLLGVTSQKRHLQTCLPDRGLPRYARKVRGSAWRFFFSVRRTHRELNEAPKRSASEESAITCHGHLCLPWPSGQQAVASCAFSRTVARSQCILHERDVDTLSTGRCLSGRPSLLTLLLKLPGQTISMWCDNIVISYRYIHITNSSRQQDATPHVDIRWDFTSQTSLETTRIMLSVL